LRIIARISQAGLEKNQINREPNQTQPNQNKTKQTKPNQSKKKPFPLQAVAAQPKPKEI
jgi:hypothetical protein